MRAGILPGHRDYRPFVIVSQARSGSNLLVSLLGSHPHVEASGELLKRLHGADVATRVAEIYGPKPRRIRAAGFKCFYYHPLDDRAAPMWERLLEVPDLHLVHLQRRNVLRTVTSRKLASLTGAWLARGAEARAGVATKPTITFTPEELRTAFEQCDRWVAECELRTGDRPLHEVAYEDLASDPACIEGVMRFLAVEPRPGHTRLLRQNPEPLSQLIEDFDGLRRAFEGTRWSRYFSDT